MNTEEIKDTPFLDLGLNLLSHVLIVWAIWYDSKVLGSSFGIQTFTIAQSIGVYWVMHFTNVTRPLIMYPTEKIMALTKFKSLLPYIPRDSHKNAGFSLAAVAHMLSMWVLSYWL